MILTRRASERRELELVREGFGFKIGLCAPRELLLLAGVYTSCKYQLISSWDFTYQSASSMIWRKSRGSNDLTSTRGSSWEQQCGRVSMSIYGSIVPMFSNFFLGESGESRRIRMVSTIP